MTSPENDSSQTVKLLATLDSLHLRAFGAESRQALIFVMLNDSVQLAHYDRAMLFSMTGSEPELLGISGQREAKTDTPYAELCQRIVREIRTPQTPQTLSVHSLIAADEDWKQLQATRHQPNVHWLPIIAFDKVQVGLWLERWDKTPWNPREVDSLKFLAQGYSLAWRPHVTRFFTRIWSKRYMALGFLFISLALIFIRLPLRVVAPCEIIAEDPFVVTAPQEGIVAEMKVVAGQEVIKGDLLFEYDKEVLLQAKRVAEKEVEIARSKLNRATAEAFDEESSLAQVSFLHLELEKQRINLALAEYRLSQLEVRASKEGVISVDEPDEWRGKPVRVGERVLSISRPEQTILRIWLPEDDNVAINQTIPIRVFLNTRPEASIPAQLVYIADYTEVSDLGVSSFQAEARWLEADENLKIGLKGTAILYGENVSLFYWMLRRPWTAFRRLTGW